MPITLDTDIALPPTAKGPAKPRKLTGVAADIYNTLPLCAIGNSFKIEGKIESVRLTAGKLATRLSKETGSAFAVKVADGAGANVPDGFVRVWRTEPKAAVKHRKGKGETVAQGVEVHAAV